MIKKNIGIIGNGFVGSAIAAGFALHANVRVFDKDPRRSINSLKETINKSNFVFISVPTPMEKVEGGKIDLQILDTAIHDAVNPIDKDDDFSFEDTIFIIKSTVIPGTTEKYKKKYPFAKFVFNPEFPDPDRLHRLFFYKKTRTIL